MLFNTGQSLQRNFINTVLWLERWLRARVVCNFQFQDDPTRSAGLQQHYIPLQEPLQALMTASPRLGGVCKNTYPYLHLCVDYPTEPRSNVPNFPTASQPSFPKTECALLLTHAHIRPCGSQANAGCLPLLISKLELVLRVI